MNRNPQARSLAKCSSPGRGEGPADERQVVAVEEPFSDVRGQGGRAGTLLLPPRLTPRRSIARPRRSLNQRRRSRGSCEHCRRRKRPRTVCAPRQGLQLVVAHLAEGRRVWDLDALVARQVPSRAAAPAASRPVPTATTRTRTRPMLMVDSDGRRGSSGTQETNPAEGGSHVPIRLKPDPTYVSGVPRTNPAKAGSHVRQPDPTYVSRIPRTPAGSHVGEPDRYFAP